LVPVMGHFISTILVIKAVVKGKCKYEDVSTIKKNKIKRLSA